jgi:hypothetical protein
MGMLNPRLKIGRHLRTNGPRNGDKQIGGQIFFINNSLIIPRLLGNLGSPGNIFPISELTPARNPFDRALKDFFSGEEFSG